LIVFSEGHIGKSLHRCARAVGGRAAVMLPKSLMNFRRLMGFISLAESHLLEAYYGLQARAMRRIAARWGVHVCRGSKAAATADGDASALPPKADTNRWSWHVRYGPRGDITPSPAGIDHLYSFIQKLPAGHVDGPVNLKAATVPAAGEQSEK